MARQILKHNVLNVSRRYRDTARRQIDREAHLNAGSPLMETASNLADPYPGPRSAIIQNEEEQRLLAALFRLPETYRTIIELRNRDRLSFAEIGTRLGRSAEAARKIWGRAVGLLRTELNSQG